MREQLILPSSVHIDYRAACFCHRRLVDIGFVCSVCLSSKTFNTLKAFYFDPLQIGRNLKVKVAHCLLRYTCTVPERYTVRTNQTCPLDNKVI